MVAQRMQQPLAQQAAAGGGAALVEHRLQRRGVVAGKRGGDLEIAARRGIEGQERAFHLDLERAHVGERRLLRGARVRKQSARGADGERHVVGAEAREIHRAHLLGKRALRALAIEMPCGQVAHRGRADAQRGEHGVLGHEHFRGRHALEHAGRLGQRHLGERESARCEIEPRNAGALALRHEGREQAVALGVEQVRVGERARRDDARHLALDRSLARRGIAELLDDHHRFALPHQLREVRLERVVGHAGHRNRRARRLPARGERDVERACRALGVGVEELVEIAHPVEHELVRMLRLDAQVLLHHRRVPGKIVHREDAAERDISRIIPHRRKAFRRVAGVEACIVGPEMKCLRRRAAT